MPAVRTPPRSASQQGAVFVEAAIALPLFLLLMFGALWGFILCFRLLSLQYLIADVTRDTATSSVAERFGNTRQAYFQNRFNTRVTAYFPPNVTIIAQLDTGTGAIGQVARGTATYTQPFLLFTLPGNPIPNVTLQLQGVAFITRNANE